MAVKLLIDVNLSSQWTPVLNEMGWPAVHWADIGDRRAPDDEIMARAVEHQHVVFTHDLDFGTMLALTGATAPSILQVRSDNTLPAHMAPLVEAALRQHETDLGAGALVVVDEARARVRVLPILGHRF